MLDEKNIILEESGIPEETEFDGVFEVKQIQSVETFAVGSDHSLASVNNTDSYLKHSLLMGRDLPGEHPITAISGLRQELNNIEELQPIYSNLMGVANYYKWNKGAREDVGYFVSMVPSTDKIQICEGEDIFGVTISEAGFAGNEGYIEEENEDGSLMKIRFSRDSSYALVATTGLVDVICESDVIEGDLVVSNDHGIARKTTTGYGYRVVAKDIKGGISYASIALGVQADQTNRIGRHLQILDERMDNAEINIASLSHSLRDTNDKVGVLEGDVSGLKDLDTKANNALLWASQAKEIAASAVTTAESLRKEAVDAANKALVDAVETRKEFEELARDMDKDLTDATLELEETKLELYEARDRLQGSINDAHSDIESMRYDLIPLESWVCKDNPERCAIAGFVAQADENAATIGTLAEYIDETNNALAGFKMTVAKNYATISMLTSLETKNTEADVAIKAIADANKAQLDAVSGFAERDEEGNITKSGLAGLSELVTKDSASLSTLASYTASEKISVIEKWNEEDETKNDKTKVYWVKSVKDGVGNQTDYYRYYNGSQWTGDVLWNQIIESKKDISRVYYVKGAKLYYYYDGSQWRSTISSYEAGLDGALAGIQQTADENSAKVAAIASLEGDFGESLSGFIANATDERADIKALASFEGGAAGLVAQVTKNKSNIELMTGLDGGIAGLKAQVDVNTSQVSLVANRVKGEYTIIPLTLEGEGKDESKIYYDGTSYWYCSNGNWNSVSSFSSLPLSSSQVYYVVGTQSYWYYKDGSWNYTEDPYEAGLPAVIGGIQVMTDDNSSQIKQLTSWRGETNTSLTQIKQKSDENGASINLLAANIDKYSIGEHSQAYNFTCEQACEVLEPGMIFIPTPEMITESYEYVTKDGDGKETIGVYECSFSKGFAYEWVGTPPTLWMEYVGKVWHDSTSPTGNAYEFWYDGEILYKQTATEGGNIWMPVATYYGNSSNRAVSQIRMDANSIALEVTNVKGDAAILSTRLTDTEAEVQSVAAWQTEADAKIATIQNKADANGASIAQVAANIGGYEEWDAHSARDENKVYHYGGYYYYYEGGKWCQTDDPFEAGVVISAASIVTAVNEDGSGILLNADCIDLEASEIIRLKASQSDVDDLGIEIDAVKEDLKLYVKSDDLNGYATKSELNLKADSASLGVYATKDELGNYATKSALDLKADSVSLGVYATKDELGDYAKGSELKSLQDQMSAKVSNSDEGETFGWSLTTAGFELYAEREDDLISVFTCDKDGVWICDGDGQDEGFSYQLTNTGFYLDSGGETVFSVDEKGLHMNMSDYVTTSQLSLLEDEIRAEVVPTSSSPSSKEEDGFGWSIDKGGFYLNTMDYDETGDDHEGKEGWHVKDTVFACDKDGVRITGEIHATSGSFEGEVNATSGTIGSWEISNGVIHSTAGIYGSYSVGYGLSVRTVTGYLFTSLESNGIWYTIKSGSTYNSETIYTTQSLLNINSGAL